MNRSNNFVSSILGTYFATKLVVECEPFFPLLFSIASSREPNVSVEEYLFEMLQNRVFLQVNTPLIHWILVTEIRRDLNLLKEGPHWDRYKALIEQYVGILFAKYMIEGEQTKKTRKTFGIRSFFATASPSDMRLYIDNRSVVYERRNQCKIDAILGRFLNRIDQFHARFGGMELSVQYNMYAEQFHNVITVNRRFYARITHRFEVFHEFTPGVRLYFCAISVLMDEKEFFVATGVDSQYYLCAEAKAMQSAIEILSNPSEVVSAQRAKYEEVEVDKDVAVAYRTPRMEAAEGRFFTLAVGVFYLQSNNPHCVTAISAISNEDARNAVCAEIEKKIKKNVK